MEYVCGIPKNICVGTYAAPGNWPDRNGNVGGYFCPSRLNHRNCGQVCPQTESVLLNAWKGKNPPPLVPNVPVRPVAGGSAVSNSVLHFL